VSTVSESAKATTIFTHYITVFSLRYLVLGVSNLQNTAMSNFAINIQLTPMGIPQYHETIGTVNGSLTWSPLVSHCLSYSTVPWDRENCPQKFLTGDVH